MTVQCELPAFSRCHYINSQTKHSLGMVSSTPNCHKILLKFHQLSCVYSIMWQNKCVPYGSVYTIIYERLYLRTLASIPSYTLCVCNKVSRLLTFSSRTNRSEFTVQIEPLAGQVFRNERHSKRTIPLLTHDQNTCTDK